MTDETVSSTTTIAASAEAVFAVLADPSSHAAIDGTGWVRDSLDDEALDHVGQIFRVDMYHPHHPDGDYEMANEVLTFEPPRAISWRPGSLSSETGDLEFGGWLWRYDLTELAPDKVEVTLTYDWSGAGVAARKILTFPPLPPDHLDNSLSHLATLVTGDAPAPDVQ